MPYPFRERVGMFLQRFVVLHPLILKPTHKAPSGLQVYQNKISGHLVRANKLPQFKRQ